MVLISSASSHKMDSADEVTDIGLNDPYGVAVDSDGLIYIADYNNRRVVVL